jgi:hypothetical protein
MLTDLVDFCIMAIHLSTFYQVNYAQPIPTPKSNLRKMSGVTLNHKKIIYTPILILFGGNVAVLTYRPQDRARVAKNY